MNSFATKYLIAVMTLGVMCMFTQDSETIKHLYLLGFILLYYASWNHL